jgi:hypothetical protein
LEICGPIKKRLGYFMSLLQRELHHSPFEGFNLSRNGLSGSSLALLRAKLLIQFCKLKKASAEKCFEKVVFAFMA